MERESEEELRIVFPGNIARERRPLAREAEPEWRKERGKKFGRVRLNSPVNQKKREPGQTRQMKGFVPWKQVDRPLNAVPARGRKKKKGREWSFPLSDAEKKIIRDHGIC